MIKKAFLFSGQGAQCAGMALPILERFPRAAAYFEEADEICGFPLSELCKYGAEEELKETTVSQPAILLCSYLWFLIYCEEHGRDADYFAGHSLGEYSALLSAGVLSFRDALHLIVKRAAYMKRAADEARGSMMAVRNPEREKLLSCIRHARYRRGLCLDLACLNSQKQLVLSGEEGAIREMAGEIEASGAGEPILLRVSGAFHSRLMEEAVGALGECLERTRLHPIRGSILSNVSGRPYRSLSEIRRSLRRQLISPVHWRESMRYLFRAGVSEFVEFGARATLSGMLRQEEANCHAKLYRGE